MTRRSELNRRHAGTLAAIFARPVSGTIRWRDIEALFVALDAIIEEREGSRVAIVWKQQVSYSIVLTRSRKQTRAQWPVHESGWRPTE